MYELDGFHHGPKESHKAPIRVMSTNGSTLAIADRNVYKRCRYEVRYANRVHEAISNEDDSWTIVLPEGEQAMTKLKKNPLLPVDRNKAREIWDNIHDITTLSHPNFTVSIPDGATEELIREVREYLESKGFVIE